jgi:hypothetical protein
MKMSGHKPTTDAPPPKGVRKKTVVQRLHEMLWRKSYFPEHLTPYQAGKVEELMRAAYDMGKRDALLEAAGEAAELENDNV